MKYHITAKEEKLNQYVLSTVFSLDSCTLEMFREIIDSGKSLKSVEPENALCF